MSLENKFISWLKEQRQDIAAANTETPKDEKTYLIQCGIYQGLGKALDEFTRLLGPDAD